MSTKQNYAIIKKNNIYYRLYSILEEKRLFMNNFQHKEEITDILKNLLNEMDIISISKKFNKGDELLENILENIGEDTESTNGGSIIIDGYKDYMYQLIYLEDVNFQKEEMTDQKFLNEYCSLSNIEIKPIYYSAAIIKITYKDGEMKNDIIKKEDLVELFLNNYYNTGVLIHNNGNLQEIQFTGDGPNLIIGNSFIVNDPVSIFGFLFVPYIESGSEINIKASKLLGKEIKGRVFIALLCPSTYKKIWNIDIETLEKILNLLEDENNKAKYESESHDMNFNPYFNLKK
jgi:hypothetical protein